MKNVFLLLFLVTGFLGYGQNQKEANVYPSNLEENLYYNKYDPVSGLITGINFLVLCDGNNSQDYTPPFEVSLYLIPEGSSEASDTIVVKTYQLKGIYHMGSHEFKDKSVCIAGIEKLKAGTYRLGICVNSNNAFEEISQDNAMLFKNEINYNPELLKKVKINKRENSNENSKVQESEEENSSENE